jgi:choline dehydrogenase
MADQYDYIVVGAGSAGCVLAARLSEDPAMRILLAEAGGSDRRLIISMPGALPFAYQSKRIGWGYQSGPEPCLGGKTIDEKAGKVIGGSSSINAMICNRGNPMDYDGWAQGGLPDWDYAHCLPYFRKMETFAGGPDEWRGGEGPVHISRCRAGHQLYDAFLQAGEQAGFALTPDHNGYRQEGMHVAQAFISQGLRWSAARAYLRPAAARPNLRVLTGALVRRILIEDGVATGIDVLAGGESQLIRCDREVILCAGAVSTPRLLLLSGIGPADELRSHGIRVVADVGAVGRNLQNHPGMDIQYSARHEDSLTAQLGMAGRARIGADWVLRKQGLGTSNFFETGAFLRTRDDVPFPNMQYEFLPLVRLLRNGKLVPVPGFQFWMDLARPESRGAVTLRSANPAAPPSIVFNHLHARQDVTDLIAGLRLARELIRQPAWDRLRGAELSPGPDAVSDADIEAAIRKRTSTSYHPCGSCRMGTDPGAVVGSDASVRAVGRLRIADASVLPRVTSGNLNAPVLMMAEKIADKIRGVPPLPPSDAGYHRAAG